MMQTMEWVRGFYERQYEWAGWRNRWADVDSNVADPHVDAVTRLGGSGPKRILELGSGTGTTAAKLAQAGHDVVAIELLPDLAENAGRLARDVMTGSLRAVRGDFYEVQVEGPFDVVAYFDDVAKSRMTERMWRNGREEEAVTQSIRCYSPADLRLLVQGTGLALTDVEWYADQRYGAQCEARHAMLFLARLSPT